MGNPMLGFWYKLYMKQTPAEQKFEKIICQLGVRYRCQHIMLSIKCFPDFYFPDYNLVVEIDDPSHLEPAKIKKDREHTKALSALGIDVIRFTNDEVLNGKWEDISQKMKTALFSRAPSLASLPPKTPTTPTSHLSNPLKKRGRPKKVHAD